MNFEELSDDEWTLVSSLVADEPPIRLNRRGRPRAEPRVVANAVLWILTTGESWSRLPARYPSGPTCRRRFDEWHVSGTLVELVERLAQVGRSFVYVPEPAPPVTAVAQTAQVAQLAQAEALETAEAAEAVEDDGLPAVYWKSPEAWQAPAAAAAPSFADPIESMTRQLSRTDHGQPYSGKPERAHAVRARSSATAAASPSTQTLQTRQTLSASREETTVVATRRVSGANGTVQSVQVAEWRGFVMNVTVQPVRNRMYRAAVEILKDGRRIERSGLIGPPFQDRDTARHFAFDWARKWIEGECRGMPGTSGVPPQTVVAANGSHTVTHTATRAPNAVVTRPAPGAAAPGNVRLAPVQRYSASGVLTPESGDANATSCSNNERRTTDPHCRPHVRTHAG